MPGTKLTFPLLVTAFLLCPLTQARDNDFPGIEQLMSEEEFRAAGLHKLSPAEREALNRWLVGYTAEDAQVLRHSSEEVRQAEQDIRIEAEVKGFRGWNGDTLFPLDNGQMWRQRLDGRFAYNGNDGRVVIEKNFFGYYRLTHVATGASVGVTRVTQ